MSFPNKISSSTVEPGPPQRAGVWAEFIAAVQLLTMLPVGSLAGSTSASRTRCAVFFPLVGGLIGVFTAAALAAGCLLWPVWLAVVLALAAEARLTGALHEDALADCCDAFGGGWTREQVLAILKDSRLGTYGVLGLVLGLAVRAGALFALVASSGLAGWLLWAAALVAASAAGRWVMVLAMVLVRPVPGRESLSQDVGGQLPGRVLVTSSLWLLLAAAPFALLMPQHCLLAATLLVPAVWGLLRYVRRRLEGVTGDCLGCIGYLSQVLVLLAAAARF